jgi:isoquinoline 1-oxidoreductase beta subunit
VNNPKNFSRRDFLKVSGVSGAVLAVGFIPGCDGSPEIVNLAENGKIAVGTQLNPFISIDSSGKVTLVTHRPEAGTGVYQSMPMLLAEELEVDMDEVELIQTSTNAQLYGSQSIGGSNSIRESWVPSRKIGAAAREMLIESAAQKWGVKSEECYASQGKIIHDTSKRTAHYGELVEAASKLSPPKEPKLKIIKDFKVIGRSLPRRDIPLKTNGTAKFGMDMEVDGMVYASIERSPVFYGKVKNFNAEEVLTIPGVRKVVKTEMNVLTKIREGVAVVADNYWAALQGRKALEVEWENGDTESWDTNRIIRQYKEAAQQEGRNQKKAGDYDKVIGEAAKTLEAEYEMPIQSHSALEPLNVLADVGKNRCDVWGPIQTPNWVRQDLADFLQLPLENVNVHTTFIGGGFGRKAYTDFSNEAAYLSRKIKAPVKVIWTREDDMTQGPFRPGSLNLLKAGFDDKGSLVAFNHKVVTTDYYDLIGGDNPLNMEDLANHEYQFPNHSYDLVASQIPVPFIWMRAVWSCTNGYAQECFVDEMADEMGQDPLDFRLKYLGHLPRFAALLEKLSDLTAWKEVIKPNTGQGIAITKMRGTIVGNVAQVSRDKNGKIRIDKITSVVDCGIVVNPDIVRQQVEGAIIMGLTASFKGEITLAKGKVEQSNFDNYDMLRYPECPEIEVHVMPSSEEPGGIGEVGMPPAGPAVANAIFDLTGKRIRKLPFELHLA